MPTNLQYLAQLRAAVTSVAQTVELPEPKAVLAAADLVLNELMRREAPAFFLDHLARGRALLAEGKALARQPALAESFAAADATCRFDLVAAAIDSLNDALLPVIDTLDESRSAQEKSWLTLVSQWEHDFYHHRLVQAPALVEPAQLTPVALQHYLRERFPERGDLRVTSFLPLDGGFSKKTILFDIEDAGGRESLVMRAEHGVNLCCYDGSEVTQEFYSIQLMQRAGLPIAEPLWLEDDPHRLGARFLVSRKAVGKTYGGNFGAEEAVSPALLNSVIDTFIRMHQVRIDPADPLAQKSHLREWLPCRTVTEAIRHHLTVFLPKVIARTDIRMTPQIKRAFKWLEHNIPDCDEPPAVVHMDYAFNNLIIDGDRVSAVLDWESSRLGDPAEDIVWTQQTLAAQISMPDFLARYEAGTGRRISAYRIAYNRVAKCVLNAITFHSSLRAIEKYEVPNIKMSMLGLKYMALLGANFNELIDAAEQARREGPA